MRRRHRCLHLSTEKPLRDPIAVHADAQAERKKDARNRAAVEVLGFDDESLGQALVVPIDEEQQVSLVSGLLRGDVTVLLHGGALVHRKPLELSGLHLEPHDRIEAGAYGSRDQRRTHARVERLVVPDVVVNQKILLGDAWHVAARPEHVFLPSLLSLRQIETPAHELTAPFLRTNLEARRLEDEGERIDLAATEVEVHAAAFGVRVHEVEGRARGPAEPAHVSHAPRARHDADEAVLVRLPDPVRTAGLDACAVGGRGKHGENHVLFGDGEVVHQRAVRRLEPFLAHELAVGIRHTESDVA